MISSIRNVQMVSIDLKQTEVKSDCCSFELSSIEPINYDKIAVEYALKTGSDWIPIDIIGKSIFKITNLKENTEYKVRMKKNFGDGSVLKELQFKTLIAPAIEPIFRINTFGTNFAILELTNSFPQFENIEVQIRKNESNEWKNHSYQMKDFKIEGLQEDSIYKMKGSVKYDKKQTPWTDESKLVISTLKSKVI